MPYIPYILNSLLILLEILGLTKIGRFEWKMFAYYTQLSNFLALISAVVFLATQGAPAAAYVRYTATCMMVMTSLSTFAILVPLGGGIKPLMLTGFGLYVHTLCPIVCAVSYIFFEPHVSVWWLPMGISVFYGVLMMVLNGVGKADGPYPFFRVKKQSAGATALWILVLAVLVGGISYGISLL